MKNKEDVNILFKQGDTDERILKSMAEDTEHEYDSEELSKALDKAKLVQKEVQVRGKNGQMHTRKQWVRAGEDQPSTKQPKAQEDTKDDSTSKEVLKVRDSINSSGVATTTNKKVADMYRSNKNPNMKFEVKDNKDGSFTISSSKVSTPAAGGSGGDDGGNKVTGKGKTINQNHWTKVGTSQEAKSQIAQMLASGKSREDCMSDFKAQGVTWKEHENPAINWMRAAMAMNKHLTSGAATSQGSEKSKDKVDKVDINLSDYTLKGDFYSVTETAKMFDLGAQVALCKKLGIDPDKYTVIQPEDADDPKSFDKFSSEINKQIGDYETMEFDDDDPDADGVSIQEYKQFSINGKTCVALSDAGMNSFIIPTEMYNKTEETKANNSVIGSDYTQLTTEKESGTIEGEAHNMMVGWLQSENGGKKKPTEAQIKQAANSLKDAAIKRVISSYNQDELVHQLAMAKHFTKLAGGNMDHMTLERTYQDVVSGSSYTQEQKCNALAKLCGKDYDSTGDYVRKYASNSMANASIVPMSKGYFEVTFSYDDGVSRKERFDSVKSAKEAADKFIEKEEKYTAEKKSK